MKSFIVVSALAAIALADTATFTNTTFPNPLTAGQTVHLTWTNGNDAPVSLSIVNSTWASRIFTSRSASLPWYDWAVTDVPGMVTGTYALALEQANGGAMSLSVPFQYTSPGNNPATLVASATSPVTTKPMMKPSITAVTHVYWDYTCGCHKTTTTAATAMNTGRPGTTTIWWDDRCSCHKTAMVPVVTMPASNNYTVPAVPPTVAATTPSTTPAAPTQTGSAAPTKFTGQAVRYESSVFGLLAVVAVAIVA